MCGKSKRDQEEGKHSWGGTERGRRDREMRRDREGETRQRDETHCEKERMKERVSLFGSDRVVEGGR